MIELIEIGKIEKIGTLRSFKGKFMDDLNRTYELTVYGTEHSIQLYKKGNKYDYSFKKNIKKKKEKAVADYTEEVEEPLDIKINLYQTMKKNLEDMFDSGIIRR
jgi:hypothetical protein